MSYTGELEAPKFPALRLNDYRDCIVRSSKRAAQELAEIEKRLHEQNAERQRLKEEMSQYDQMLKVLDANMARIGVEIER